MSNESPLGKLIESQQGRDAVHVAIAPVVASETLSPGEHVGFVDDSRTVGKCDRPIGIIDPFLRNVVREGDKCFLLLYPNSITSLRHEWTHPDFDGPSVEESRAWIEAFADQLCMDYDDLIRAADRWVDRRDWTYDNSESYKDHYEKFDEFWTHYERVTGLKVDDKSCPFTCSC